MKIAHTEIPDSLSELDNYLTERESCYKLKPGTEAKIIWNGGQKWQQTDYAIVYLHGFRASHPEGEPVHRVIAEQMGYNLYLSRFDEHGLQTEQPLFDLTTAKLLRSARFACKIGCRIGKKVILMGTSTGGSLALYLAAQTKLKATISSLVLYSPLIELYGLNQTILTCNVSRKILGLVPGSGYLLDSMRTSIAEERIWYHSYALGGALALGSFVKEYMHKRLFSLICCPVFVGYFYKNRHNQDRVVSVKAIKKMIRQLEKGAPYLKTVNYMNAGTHIICSSLLSKAVQKVIADTETFLKSVEAHNVT